MVVAGSSPIAMPAVVTPSWSTSSTSGRMASTASCVPVISGVMSTWSVPSASSVATVSGVMAFSGTMSTGTSTPFCQYFT